MRDLDKRIKIHLCSNGCRKISNALKKYGVKMFQVTVLWESADCTRDELSAKEIEFIKLLNTMHPHGYNLTAGGEGGLAPTEETRRLISQGVKEAWRIKGEKWLQDRKERGFSDEVREKMAEGQRRRHANDPEEAKRLGNIMRGREVSTETRRKLGDATRRRDPAIVTASAIKRRKPLYCFSGEGVLIKRYESLLSVEEDGIANSSARHSIRNGTKHKGMYFSYSSTLPSVATVEAAEECRHGF